MTLTIELTAEQEYQIQVASQQKGIAPAALVEKLISEYLPSITSGILTTIPNMTIEERIEAMDVFAEQNRGLPILSDQAFDRANLYDERL